MTNSIKFIDPHNDQWHEVVADDSIVAVPACQSHCILSLDQWLAVRASWSPSVPKGLTIANDVDLEEIEADLHGFGLISLQFPKWTDGRAYTQAHLLRARYGFKGEVRATGDVLVDMLPLLQRNGVDSVVLRHDQDRAAAERALGFFPQYYQGDVNEPRPRFEREAQGVTR